MDNLGSRAPVSPVEHRLVYHQSSLDVLGGLSNVTPPAVQGAQAALLPPSPALLIFHMVRV